MVRKFCKNTPSDETPHSSNRKESSFIKTVLITPCPVSLDKGGNTDERTKGTGNKPTEKETPWTTVAVPTLRFCRKEMKL